MPMSILGLSSQTSRREDPESGRLLCELNEVLKLKLIPSFFEHFLPGVGVDSPPSQNRSPFDGVPSL